MLTVDTKVNRNLRVSPDRRERGTREERMARGREAAAACPVEALAGYTPATRRADAIALLTEQSASRVAELIPIRYGRMSASAFAFFRGSAIIQARDLVQRPVTGIEVQAVGDAHIANFGMFLSPTRHLVFDINDFDECAPVRMVACACPCPHGRWHRDRVISGLRAVQEGRARRGRCVRRRARRLRRRLCRSKRA